MKLKMDKSSYRAQKIVREGEKATVILAEPQVRYRIIGRCVQKYTDTVTGCKYALRLMALKMF